MSFCLWGTDEIYKDHFSPGIYVCSKCDYELFSSITKFEHESPWPAFSETIHRDSVTKKRDRDMDLAGRDAVKVSCGKCGQGLGHEFFKDCPDGKSRF